MPLFGKKNKKNEIENDDEQFSTEQILESLATKRTSINPDYFKRQVKDTIERYLIAFYSGNEMDFPYENMTDNYLRTNIELLRREKNNRIQRNLYKLSVNNVKASNIDDTLMYSLSSIEFEVTFVVKFSIAHSTFIQADEKELKVNYLFVNGTNYRNKSNWILDREVSRKEIKSTPFDLNTIQISTISPNQMKQQYVQPTMPYLHKQNNQQPYYQVPQQQFIPQPNQYGVVQGQYPQNQNIGYMQPQQPYNNIKQNMTPNVPQQQVVFSYPQPNQQNGYYNQNANNINNPQIHPHPYQNCQYPTQNMAQQNIIDNTQIINDKNNELINAETQIALTKEQISFDNNVENNIASRKDVTHPKRKTKKDYIYTTNENDKENDKETEQDIEQVNRQKELNLEKKISNQIDENEIKKNKNVRKNTRMKDDDLIVEDIL